MKKSTVFFGEFLGTLILTLFGCGSVAVSVLFAEHTGLFQIAMLWGFGVALAIYTTRGLSGAHLNPAVSTALFLLKKITMLRLLNDWIAQFTGAFVAGWLLLFLFNPSIVNYEAKAQIIRGEPESIQTAKIFGEFYPNPSYDAEVSLPLAMFAEAFGTFLLVGGILLLTDSRHGKKLSDDYIPLCIGLLVSSIICLIAPLTQAGLNPARDFSPRLVASLAGWGETAYPSDTGGFFWVYIVAPLIGAAVATLISLVFRSNPKAEP